MLSRLPTDKYLGLVSEVIAWSTGEMKEGRGRRESDLHFLSSTLKHLGAWVKQQGVSTPIRIYILCKKYFASLSCRLFEYSMNLFESYTYIYPL